MNKTKASGQLISTAAKKVKRPATASNAAIKRKASRILQATAVSRRSRAVIEGTATKYARALKRLADK